jgi:hypothetical protein
VTVRTLALVLCAEHYVGLIWLACEMIKRPPVRLYSRSACPEPEEAA